VVYRVDLRRPRGPGPHGGVAAGCEFARLVNVVVVLEWSSFGKPVNDKTAWVLSSDLLSVAMHRATG
jgi:hypothetical protein